MQKQETTRTKNKRARFGLKLIALAAAIYAAQFIFMVAGISHGMGGFTAFLKGDVKAKDVEPGIRKDMDAAMSRSLYATMITWPVFVVLGLTGFGFVVSGIFWAEKQGPAAKTGRVGDANDVA